MTPDREDVIARLEEVLRQHGAAGETLRAKGQGALATTFEESADAARDALTLLREEWLSMENAPKDGARILLAWGDMVVIGHWLDNSHTSHPWAGWRHEGMLAPRGRPRAWRPLPPLPDREDG